MGYSNRRRKTAADVKTRQQKIADLNKRLEAFSLCLTEAEVSYITAKWDGYSQRNALLIAMQAPNATDVDGYKAWLGRGRQVRKGEHGIMILAPAGQSDPEVDENGNVIREGRQFFKLAYVFDIAQTEPLEKPAELVAA